MADYRLYSLDAQGRIGFADEFTAEDDAQAVAMVALLKPNARQWEVWDRKRLIAEGSATKT